VVGDTPTAVGVEGLDAPVAVEVRGEGQLLVGGPAPARVHARVLEQEQRVRQLARLPQLADALLHGDGLQVGDSSQLAHPEVGERARSAERGAHLSTSSSLAPRARRAAQREGPRLDGGPQLAEL
jgi:hypothetical protein